MAEKALEVYEFSSKNHYKQLCGVHDRFIGLYENLLSIEIIPRGCAFHFKSKPESISVDRVQLFFSRLEDYTSNLGSEGELEEFDIKTLYRQTIGDNPETTRGENMPAEEDQVLNSKENKLFTTPRGRAIYPKTRAQEQFVRFCREKSITLAIGPAGTGKTFLSVVLACAAMERGEAEKIVLSRPAVEAGENLGFLPGDMASKVDPYLRPLYDGLYECYGFERVQKMTTEGSIEVAPLAFMRGRNIANSFILLDEAQNCTYNQLKMFLTRLGRNSRMIICGDITQVDLTRGSSGLPLIMEKLEPISEIGTLYFTEKDICRHPLVEKIVMALND